MYIFWWWDETCENDVTYQFFNAICPASDAEHCNLLVNTGGGTCTQYCEGQGTTCIGSRDTENCDGNSEITSVVENSCDEARTMQICICACACDINGNFYYKESEKFYNGNL